MHRVSAVSWHDAHVKNLAEYGGLNLDDELQAIQQTA